MCVITSRHWQRHMQTKSEGIGEKQTMRVQVSGMLMGGMDCVPKELWLYVYVSMINT